MRRKSLIPLAVAICLTMFGATPVSAQQVSLDEFQALQRRLAAQEARIHQLEARRLPPVDEAVQFHQASHDMALERRLMELEELVYTGKDGKNGGGSSGASRTQKWTGRVHADWWGFPGSDAGSNFYETANVANSPRDRFLFRRLRFGLAGDILETMLYKAEFDWGNGRINIKDAYIGWRELPWLRTVLLGNQKRPYGLDHLNSSRYNVFMERPFTVEAIAPDSRRFGLASYGVSDDVRYNWRFGTYLATDIQNTGTYITTDDPGVQHYQAEFSGRFANTIWYDESSGGRGYAHWAVSGGYVGVDGTAGANNAGRFATRPEARTSSRWIDTGRIVNADYYTVLGLEGVTNVGPVQVVGEYQTVRVHRVGAGDLDFQGGYMYVAYFLTGEHEPWTRERGTIGRVKPFENFFLVRHCDGGRAWGWGAWQVAARYSYGDFTDADIQGGVGTSFTLGLNWWWTPYSRVQFNYIQGDIEQRGGGGPTEGEYSILGSRFMVDF